MSDVKQQPQPHLRYVGGESGHRSFFGGTQSKSRIIGLTIFILGGMIGMLVGGGLWALGIALVGIGVVFVFTMRTHNGTIQERRRKRRRWAARQRLGTDVFVPYNVAGWDQVQAALTSTDKRERAAGERAARQMRVNPEGADGMGWLQYGSNQPGIAWHAPLGEQPYLSVAFAVSGQLRGMGASGVIGRGATAWGKFLAHRAGADSLVRDVQTLTRMLPPDTAKHDIWYDSQRATLPVDASDAERELLQAQERSYAEVRARSSKDAMVQRHFVILSWPLTPAFIERAAKFAPGRDGWRALMAKQIDATMQGLRDAKMGSVSYLTARQTAALIMHQQNPSVPIDLRSARHINPLSVGIGSHDEYSAHVVDGGYDPTVLLDDDPIEAAPAVEWWHRTAAIHGEDLSAAARSPLWTLDLLIGRDLDFIRSISFHMHLVPAAQAKTQARQDVVRDAAAVLAQKEKGALISDESEGLLSAAERRRRDLAAGSHHHGVSWVAYVTVTAPTRADLAQASRQLESVCDTGLGINRLDWQDSFQSAASGTTWPIGRGLRPDTSTAGARVMNLIAGRGDKEALS